MKKEQERKAKSGGAAGLPAEQKTGGPCPFCGAADGEGIRIRPGKHRELQLARTGTRKLFDRARKEIFLQWFALTAGFAAAQAGVDRRTVSKHRLADPEFEEAYRRAVELAVPDLQARLFAYLNGRPKLDPQGELEPPDEESFDPQLAIQILREQQKMRENLSRGGPLKPGAGAQGRDQPGGARRADEKAGGVWSARPGDTRAGGRQVSRAEDDFGDLLEEAADLAQDWTGWEQFLKGLPEPVKRRLFEEWLWQAHGGQKEPRACEDGSEWRVWLLMAGRGFGKTRTGAEWVWARARELADARIALVGANRDDVAKVMIEGPSGLIALARTGEGVEWAPSRGQLRFSSGAEAFVYSGAAPEKLRGPEHHFAWCDELAKWRNADAAWDNLQMGLRLGARPRLIATTTPRSVPILKRLRELAGTVETGGRTGENVHVPQAFVEWAEETYGGTRLGRQELEGELFEEAEGALFTRATLEAARDLERLERHFLKRVVVGVDPPAGAGGVCGIVVAGLGGDGIVYVLDDRSLGGARPEGWARAVVKAAEAWEAALIVAERNMGGDMVESVLRGVGAGLPVKLVHASRSKAARAEPVAALFESGKARLAGRFGALEEELAGLIAGGGYEGAGSRKSPDRADAMVWAVSELARPISAPRVLSF